MTDTTPPKIVAREVIKQYDTPTGITSKSMTVNSCASWGLLAVENRHFYAFWRI